MGCDIHTFAEVKVNGKWEENTDKVFLNWNETDKINHPSDSRHYDWFSVLANVRNGYGVAGVKTGQGFAVIAEPRGIPEDASQGWLEKVDSWGSDMHSKSYLTIEDFDAFDWNQVTMKCGYILLEDYKKLRGTTNQPETYCGGISGENILTMSMAEADSIRDGRVHTKEIYVLYEWPITYRECFEHELQTIVVATGQRVVVYALKEPVNGKAYALYADGGKTTYAASELRILQKD